MAADQTNFDSERRAQMSAFAASFSVPLPLNDEQLYWLTELQPFLRKVPAGMWGGIIRYILCGHVPGDFLYAVLCNNLMVAAGRADERNQLALFDWCVLLYSAAPSPCFRSPERVAAWAAHRGLLGAEPVLTAEAA